MKWKKSYEIGVEVIDRHHENLINKIDEFNKSISDTGKNTHEEMGKLIKYLISYITYHFKAEEEIMENIGYPELDYQKSYHKQLTNNLKEVLLKFKNNEHYSPIEFYYFLQNWIDVHILSEDIKIGEYFKKNNFKSDMNIKITTPDEVINFIESSIKKLKNNSESNPEYDLELNKSILLHDYFWNYNASDKQTFAALIKAFKELYKRGIISKNDISVILKELSIKHDINIKETLVKIEDLSKNPEGVK